jgi:hypothetical protein
MSVYERTYGGRRGGYCMRVQSGRYDLLVENREYYTRYSLESIYTKQIILRHEVRTPEPFPIRPAQIIYARTIPWFMWIYYGIRDVIRKYRESRELNDWWEREQLRREEIRRAVKDRGLGRFGGRYNR